MQMGFSFGVIMDPSFRRFSFASKLERITSGKLWWNENYSRRNYLELFYLFDFEGGFLAENKSQWKYFSFEAIDYH